MSMLGKLSVMEAARAGRRDPSVSRGSVCRKLRTSSRHSARYRLNSKRERARADVHRLSPNPKADNALAALGPQPGRPCWEIAQSISDTIPESYCWTHSVIITSHKETKEYHRLLGQQPISSIKSAFGLGLV